MKTYEYIGLVTYAVHTKVLANSQEEADRIVKERTTINTDDQLNYWVGYSKGTYPYDIYLARTYE